MSMTGQEAAQIYAAMRGAPAVEGDESYVIVRGERYDLTQVEEVTILDNGEAICLAYKNGVSDWFSGRAASDLLAHFEACLPEWAEFDEPYWVYRP